MDRMLRFSAQPLEARQCLHGAQGVAERPVGQGQAVMGAGIARICCYDRAKVAQCLLGYPFAQRHSPEAVVGVRVPFPVIERRGECLAGLC